MSQQLWRVLACMGLVGCLVGSLLLPAAGEAARRRLTDSPHLTVVPPPGDCDVVITPKNQDETFAMLNDPDKRVFCVDPGNYRRQLHVRISSSGTRNARRYLRVNEPFPAPVAWDQKRRAVLHGIELNRASWWVIEGLTIQPVDRQNLAYLVGLNSSSHNVLEGNYLDARHQPNHTIQRGVKIGANRNEAPSTHNFIQRNVIRGGNKSRLAVDYTGVSVVYEDFPGGSNSFNKILDNEIYDWGDGVQVSAHSSDCNASGSVAKGTLIDGNDIYVRKAKYVDCDTGAPDPRGGCSCAENGIDIKTPGGSKTTEWTRITNNRLWGFRPTLRKVVSCGGSGARGTAINAGNDCAAHVFVANNVISDANSAVVTQGSDWTVVGNLIYDIGYSGGIGGLALFPISTDTRVQYNTIVGVDNAYSDTGSGVETICNAVIGDEGLRGEGARRGADHVVKHNDLYAAVGPDLQGPTTQSYPADFDSENVTLCVERQRYTGAQYKCIPFARTTQASPHHLQRPKACTTDPAAKFGLSGLSYP
ncbi:MAG: hypothetical protein QNK05_14630 [Myxococcota bacterium]|nr:hypothetical protein [Myxococcota bacterium]